MDLEIAKGYIPHAYQRKLHESGKRFVCAAAGVRGGKTYSCAVEFVRRIALDIAAGRVSKSSGFGKRRRPKHHSWLVAPTAALLREPLRYLFEVIPAQWIERYYESEHALWLRGDILIELKTADRPEHLVASGLNGLWIDEAARLKPDSWRGQLRQRLSDKQGWALFSTTPLGQNWLYEDVVKRSGVDPEFETIQWKTSDSPYILAAEIESAKRQMSKKYFEREYEASFTAFTGTVFDEFSEKIHVQSENEFRLKYNCHNKPLTSLFRRVIAGVDWGWTSPGAIVVVGDLGGKYVVLDESYAANRHVIDPTASAGTTWVSEAKRLQANYGISLFKCDPAEPGNIYDFQRSGIPAEGANNNISYGLRKMIEAIHPQETGPRLTVLSHCKNFIEEAKKYQWAQVRGTDSFQEVPMSNQLDHSIDAARYAMADLMAHETIATPQGGQRSGIHHGPVF